MKNWRSIPIPVLWTLLTMLIFRTVLIIGFVPSESMEPTIHKNSFVLGLRLYGELKTGDVIIFRHDGKLLVKRIAVKAPPLFWERSQSWRKWLSQASWVGSAVIGVPPAEVGQHLPLFLVESNLPGYEENYYTVGTF